MLIGEIDVTGLNRVVQFMRIKSRTNLPIRPKIDFDGYNNDRVDTNIYPEIEQLVYGAINSVSSSLGDMIHDEEDGYIKITPFFGTDDVEVHKDRMLADRSMIIAVQGGDGILFRHADSSDNPPQSFLFSPGAIFLFDPNENHGLSNRQKVPWFALGVDFYLA